MAVTKELRECTVVGVGASFQMKWTGLGSNHIALGLVVRWQTQVDAFGQDLQIDW